MQLSSMGYESLTKCMELRAFCGDTHVPRVEHDIAQCWTPLPEFLNVLPNDGPSLGVPFLSTDANPDALQRVMPPRAQHLICATNMHVELLELRECADDPARLERRHARPKLKHAHLRSERLRERLECLRARGAAQYERLERGQGPIGNLARDERGRRGARCETERAERTQA